MGAAFGLGFIIGPVLGGLFAHFGPRVPFVVAAVLSLCNFLYGLFLVPESLPLERRRPFEWARANAVASLIRLGKYPKIIGLVVALVLLYLAGSATQSVWTFYTILKFHWNERLIGYSLGAVGLGALIVQGGLVRVLMPRLGPARAIVIGLTFYIIGFLLYSFASQGWMMFAITCIYCLGGLAGPALQGSISGQVPPNEQGELQGALTSLVSATGVVGPLFMTSLFAWFTRPRAPLYFPGMPFLVGAGLSVVALLVAAGPLRRLPPAIAAPATPEGSGH
nr:MFS transporter [Hymenobacter sp. BRD67]